MVEKIREAVNRPENKKRLSETQKNLWKNPEYRAKVQMAMKGRKRSEETKRKCSESLKKTFALQGGNNKGKKWSAETNKKKGKFGEENAMSRPEVKEKQQLAVRTYGKQWKGGITPINRLIRSSTKYKVWRHSVFERDNYTCQHCGIRGGNLEADHIAPFSKYPALRFSIDNGRTLCVPCHKKTPTWGKRK